MLDDTDRRIIEVLERDARTLLRGIAEEVGVSLGTVSNRVKKLEDNGVIKDYRVILDSEKVGWNLNVVIGLRIQKGSMIDVQQQIAADPRVFAVYDVTGDYDSMVLARVRGRKDLDDLTKTVFTLKGVQRSFTQVVLNTVKEDGRVVPPSEDFKSS